MIKIASWNIRGLNDPLKQREVRSFVFSHQIACVALVETKVKAANKDSIVNNLLKGWQVFANYNWDASGRIWILWNPKVVVATVIGSSDQFVHMSLTLGDEGLCVFASFVYGSNDHVHRRKLWHSLIAQAGVVVDVPWIVIGDFNAVRFPNERRGGAFDWPLFMEDFDDAMCHAGLEDLRFGGLFYTWHNARKNGHIMRKLDRALVNAAWLSKFEASSAEFLPFGVSDHSPVVVDIGIDLPKVRRPFKFFNHWADYEEFIPTVEEEWKKPVQGYAMYRVYKKLKFVKEALRGLSSKKGSRSFVLENELREELFSIQSSIASNGGSPDLLDMEKDCRHRLSCVSKDLESSMKQKSRVQWLRASLSKLSWPYPLFHTSHGFILNTRPTFIALTYYQTASLSHKF